MIESTTLFDSASADLNWNNGSQFKVNLIYPLKFPDKAKNACIYVNSARVWWTVPNLEATSFVFSSGLGPQSVPVAKGLYDLPLLSQTIANGLSNLSLNPGLFTFTPNLATQTVNITFATAGLQIDFTNSTIGKMMGFADGVYPPIPSLQVK